MAGSIPYEKRCSTQESEAPRGRDMRECETTRSKEPTAVRDRLLSVRDLRVALGNLVVLRGLSFEVYSGDCLAIIGPNGSGKTVLLKALQHLIPYEGEIHWSREARIGYVPQSIAADRQLPLRVRELLEAKAQFLHLGDQEMEQVSSELNLSPEFLNAGIGTLSGGQFQKVLIAFAMLGRPNVLLFDEPTASLDELSEEHIYEMVHKLQCQKGITVILVSHDLSVVYRYASRVLCVSKGKTCMGTPKEILTPETLEELYGAPPKYYRHIEEH
ncbi:MAG TPA: metal ABC transporter ATP-binding protein [Candidatus Acidoferrum sp.]|nr:metal ABC transporter ATP-binding protein [Candidatus Acidoferrum sp.]